MTTKPKVQRFRFRKAEAATAEATSAEGIEKGHWVVLDFGDVIMHVFYEALRPHYDIEGLWAKAPRMKELERLAQSASVRAA